MRDEGPPPLEALAAGARIALRTASLCGCLLICRAGWPFFWRACRAEHFAEFLGSGGPRRTGERLLGISNMLV
jgi:hypothetical protein